MKQIMLLTLLCFIILSCQDKVMSKKDYLLDNRFDLNNPAFEFPQNNFKIIGFGAYHGSAKTEDVELKLLESLIKQKAIKYYLPETDFSIAHYFNMFLKNGDTLLLKDLVEVYGMRVSQERTIEVYEKWKQLKQLNDELPNEDKIEVLGIDYQVNYKYTSKHILELVKDVDQSLKYIQEIKQMVDLDTTSFARGDLSYAYKKLKNLTDDYEINKNVYVPKISNLEDFEHIIRNLKITFKSNKEEREQVIYNNYLALDKRFHFNKNSQFLRMGFSHIMKAREGEKGYSYFFNRLIENIIYNKEDILSITGFLTNSEVVWDELFHDNGDYKGYTKEAGFGIGDYEKEYFRGIQNLKDTKISDKTLFRLNKSDSPYSANEPDLIEVVMTEEKSNGEAVQGMSTTEFLDYAVLISSSKASTPIYEMQ